MKKIAIIFSIILMCVFCTFAQTRKSTSTSRTARTSQTSTARKGAAAKTAATASPFAGLTKALSAKANLKITSVAELDNALSWAKGIEDKFGESLRSKVEKLPDGKFRYNGSLRAYSKDGTGIDRYYDGIKKLEDYIDKSKYYGRNSQTMLEGASVNNSFLNFLILQHINDMLSKMPNDECRQYFKADMVALFMSIDSFVQIVNIEAGISQGGAMANLGREMNYNSVASETVDFLSEVSESLESNSKLGYDPSEEFSKVLSVVVFPVDTYGDDASAIKTEFNEAKTKLSNAGSELVSNYSKWLAAYPGHGKKADDKLYVLFRGWMKILKDAGVDVDQLLRKAEEENRVYGRADQAPSFVGGETEMYKWLAANIKYPENAGNASGRVMVDFVVKKDGSISDATVKLKKNTALDAEAIRVVSAMPKWVPGRINGQPVSVRHSVTILFRK